MRLPVLFIVFILTIGILFFSDNFKTPGTENQADIIKALEGRRSTVTSPSPSLQDQSPLSAQDTPAPQTGRIFYTSSHSRSKYYYCDTDSSWKSLSPEYLKSFNSETELLQNYERILHKPC